MHIKYQAPCCLLGKEYDSVCMELTINQRRQTLHPNLYKLGFKIAEVHNVLASMHELRSRNKGRIREREWILSGGRKGK